MSAVLESPVPSPSAQQPASVRHGITIAILAMGGEGGGVLADWLVDLAEQNGYYAQTTSVPGVAQRTGATVYYLEMFPEAATPAGRMPVMALSPIPGDVDIVIASELMEAGRALQRGLVTADRTTFVASTHRVYSMTERTAMGDGRVSSDKLLAGAHAAARQFISADFAQLAEDTGSLISPSLYGALAATGRLPFSREQFEATIRRGGVGVNASLKAFAAGFSAAQAPAAVAGMPTPAAMPAVGTRLAGLAARIQQHFPPACHVTLAAGIVRLADYQDVAYAGSYLDRLQPLLARLPDDGTLAADLLDDTARHLALWMSYEDTVRVADLKTRRSRFARVGSEVHLSQQQHLGINEFLHPRVEEIADTLPAALGRWLLATPWARACVAPFTRKGRVVQTSSIRGYLLLYAIAAMRPLRPGSLRFHIEQQRISDWLARIEHLALAQPALALEVARAQRLVKGYGDTHARGWHSFQRVMAKLPQLQTSPQGAQQLRDLSHAALADDSGQALEKLLSFV
ncbi:MAG: indolepyruvate oxidoreductase subunit beta family protein [Polaromonas sp.]|uniref:indolepyruvate oxidoreductase subunit beta family protein n=1 Tax=Polaromonas sp. TaxID=1869339 RepID=UPI0027324AAB|nr:indolepyruvate oxidoreductase subunit beta family protein [Polaromonas sp.]MDP2819300.1 indolepyruvate oxidoreductase subunit beta family protein [Polaromonas sp.]